MTTVEVTAEMVLAVAAVTPERARSIAAYATRRYGGLFRVDASREAGVSESTARVAEKLLPLLSVRYGLPALSPTRAPGFYPRDWSARGVAGAHQTNHVGRGLTSPTCPHCTGGAS